MKFINILTEANQDYLNGIIDKMSISEIEYIESLYSKFSAIEYIDDNDNECMFAILDDNLLVDISNLYILGLGALNNTAFCLTSVCSS
jgi:hypothetical protein